MKLPKLGLLPKIIVAILLGILCGFFFPDALTRVFLTFNSLFGNFLSFIIPLLIIGLVTPGIADLGRSAGRLLAITALLAYGFTVMSGYMTYGACEAIYPTLLRSAELPELGEQSAALAPYFTVEMPPIMGVMSALIAAFVMGLGIAYCEAKTIKSAFDEFKAIITTVIMGVIIPLLPLYIFGIFLQITVSGQVAAIMGVFLKLIILIFALTALLLVVQFSIAGVVAKKNPLKMLRTMMTAYFTALGTQSSAATIPVTLEQTLKLGVRPELASFTVPPFGQHDEDRCLRNGNYVALRRVDHISRNDLVYSDVGRYDGGRPGSPRRSHYGGYRSARIDARIRRNADRPDDRPLYRNG